MFDDHQRNGYATAMLNAITILPKTHGKMHVLEVYEWNRNAIACYEKCGFTLKPLSEEFLQVERLSVKPSHRLAIYDDNCVVAFRK